MGVSMWNGAFSGGFSVWREEITLPTPIHYMINEEHWLTYDRTIYETKIFFHGLKRGTETEQGIIQYII